ncbi:Endonuclease related to archaeal Holliday junction resolvase [Candidatus Nitrososphaera evergladensis SR1]|uniref:Endonuclease related to archaeal Holliday junction resolvase n=1 Tax=Candidatus Nitrososphaera evergladensis SR1 TaxID=1459636 RepID=A0A075MVC0_9ARCH|nr:Holliday junction resolvase-like protein [Candidatus Nitrososphaera evergladensis]AIF84607.1 Endonuclease related to archaeal Holliday junction resolvase [Candidatus Nitrososphaera evergladensis SR1]
MANDILELFQSFRTILCLCPYCNQIQRLSDINPRYGGRIKKTWLDIYESRVKALEKKVEAFEEKAEELRQSATEKGRKQVPDILRRSMSIEFMNLSYNPYDIKALMHPVDFIIFDGLHSAENVKEIIFLSKKISNNGLNKIRESIRDAIRNGSYNWQVARVDLEGKITYHQK